MTAGLVLRMAWRDPGTAIVHRVEIDLATFEPSPLRERLLTAPPPAIALVNPDVSTACGDRLPHRLTLERDLDVTCEPCLEAEGTPAVEWASMFLRHRRLAVA